MLKAFFSFLRFVWLDTRGELDLTTLGAEIKGFTAEAKASLAKLAAADTEAAARLLALEQSFTAPRGGGGFEEKSAGQLIIESDGFKAMQGGGRTTGQIKVGSFHKTAIVNATGQNQPLVADARVPGIIGPGQQRLTVRNLLPNLRTNSNLVQFARESSKTDAAASQTGGSPNAGENVAKAESALGFELDNAAVQTIATWLPVSRQILSDASGLQDYINSRLRYFVALEEERQLLSGSGSGNDLSGLITEADTYDTDATDVANDTFIDVIAHAIDQVSLSNFEADAIVMNPSDFWTLSLIKQSGSGISSGQYIYANPHSAVTPSLWGLPVVATRSMARSQFLVGAFRMAAAIHDREDATVEVSREHADFFIKNMAAVLVEERLTLTVYRPDALVYGGFPYGS
ncbi:MAG: phage major capsid protein [Terriglobales bacterium]